MDSSNFRNMVEAAVRDCCSTEVKVALKGRLYYPLLEKLFGGLRDPREELGTFVEMYRAVFATDADDESDISIVSSEVVPTTDHHHHSSNPPPPLANNKATRFCLEQYRMSLHNCFNSQSISSQVFVRAEDLRVAHEDGLRSALSWLEQQEDVSGELRMIIKSTLEKEFGWISVINNERFRKHVHQQFRAELRKGTHLLQNSFCFKSRPMAAADADGDTDNGPKGELQAMNEQIDNEIKSRVQSFTKWVLIPQASTTDDDEAITNLVKNKTTALTSKLGELGRQVKSKNEEFLANFATSYLDQVLREYEGKMGSFLGTSNNKSRIPPMTELEQAHQKVKEEGFQKWESKMLALDRAFLTTTTTAASQLVVKLKEMMEQSFSQLVNQRREEILKQYFEERRERNLKEAMQLMEAIGAYGVAADNDDNNESSFCALYDSLLEVERSFIKDKLLATVQTGRTGTGEEDGNMAIPETPQNPNYNNNDVPTSIISVASTSTNNYFGNTTTSTNCSLSSSGTGGGSGGPGEEAIPQASSSSHHNRIINPPNSEPGHNSRVTKIATAVRPPQANATTNVPRVATGGDHHQLQPQQSPPSSSSSSSSLLAAGHASSSWDLQRIPNSEHLLPKAKGKKRKIGDPAVIRESLHTFGITIRSGGGLRAAITIDNIPHMLVESSVVGGGESGEEGEKANIIPLLVGRAPPSDTPEFIVGNAVQRLKDQLLWHFDVGQLISSEHSHLKQQPALTAAVDLHGNGTAVTVDLELLLGIIIHTVKTIMEEVLQRKFGGKPVSLEKLVLSLPPHVKLFQLQQVADATIIMGLKATSVAILAEPTLLAFDCFRKELQGSGSQGQGNICGYILAICQYSDYVVLDLLSYSRDKQILTISPMKTGLHSVDLVAEDHNPPEKQVFDGVSNYLKNSEFVCDSRQRIYVCLKTETESYTEAIRNALSSAAPAIIDPSRVFQFDEFPSARGVTSVGNYGYWGGCKKQVVLSQDRFILFKGDQTRDLDPANLSMGQVTHWMNLFRQLLIKPGANPAEEPDSSDDDGTEEPRKRIRV